LSHTGPNTILLVEDEDTLRLSMEIKLKVDNRYGVVSCATGEEAIELLKEHKFDIVLLDYRLPGISGLDVLKWMHNEKILTPVIILSGIEPGSIPLDAMRFGAYQYIKKHNLDFEVLLLDIESVYERYLYRMELLRKEKEDFAQRQKQEEMNTLRIYQDNVTSVGNFVVDGLTSIRLKIEHTRTHLTSPREENKEQSETDFEELMKDIDLILSGVQSMVNLSTFVAKKLNGFDTSGGIKEK
jgi:DNA-binding NarL/FixJ family response regulator